MGSWWGLNKKTQQQIQKYRAIKELGKEKDSQRKKRVAKVFRQYSIEIETESMNLIEENTRNFEITIISFLLIQKTWLNL